jgi:CheY-like chemotaxis protein
MMSHVLIVDDDSISRKILMKFLEPLGYTQILTASDGKTAIEIAKNNELELIFQDINLEGELDGVDTSRLMQEHCQAPVVFITANLRQDVQDKVFGVKNEGFLLKPFTQEIVTQFIKNIERKRRRGLI